MKEMKKNVNERIENWIVYVFFMHQDLRAHIERSSNERTEHLSVEVINCSSESKISQFMLIASYENVFWLEVTMDNTVFE